MTTVYVDTSALARVLLDEPDKHAVQRDLAKFAQRVASRLLRVELRRVGLRRELLDRANTLAADVSLIPIDNWILTATETLTPHTVGTLDAIHLATALRLSEERGLDALMTYDEQLAAGAQEHGIAVLSPS
ncbi:MAG: type II toxin-antitoxin system VapC family toxin [Solirubrobacteraceae bacterium]